MNWYILGVVVGSWVWDGWKCEEVGGEGLKVSCKVFRVVDNKFFIVVEFNGVGWMFISL